MQRGRSPISLADLMEAGLVHPGQELCFKKNPSVCATLGADGRLAFRGNAFASPSTAGRAATNGGATNGWIGWFVKDGDKWISLDALRKRLLAR